MPFPQINSLLEACAGPNSPFPPTDLFQEKWLIRIVLDWFATHRGCAGPLRFAANARWFSEAYLPSAFLARRGYRRRDPLAEKWSHADGVAGHFVIGAKGKTDLSLAQGATQLKVLEGKIFSPLSPGVTNVPYYDQAARSVACVAEVLKRGPRPPDQFGELAFYVLAPRTRIESGLFATEMQKGSIRRKVKQRVDAYVGTHDAWFQEWFEPTLERIDLQCITWESVIDTIRAADAAGGEAIGQFYVKCLNFCAPRARADGEDDAVAEV